MTQHRDDQGPAMLDALIGTITVDAHSDDERLWEFRQVGGSSTRRCQTETPATIP
jgi:hypothetical protein